MRIAVFSDIHGNPFVAEAVLNAIKADGVFEAVVCAGDICLGGSGPAKCVDLLREHGALATCGNVDEYVLHPGSAPEDASHRSKWDEIQPQAYWAREQIGAERLDWLSQLSFDLHFSPTDSPEDDLLAFHANPQHNLAHILPPPEEQVKLFGEVRQPDDDEQLIAWMDGVQASVMAFGHLHYTSLREWRGRRLVNVAPCSGAPYDGDQRGRYTVFNWENDKWEIERRYVDYDWINEVKALKASDFPGKTERLRLWV
jgi:predicted phosphodiesterase